MHGVTSFRFRGGLGMIYSRNSRVLGDVFSPTLGLLVPECNVALACEQCCARDYLTAQQLQRVYIHMAMHASESVSVCMRLCMCLHVHRGP